MAVTVEARREEGLRIIGGLRKQEKGRAKKDQSKKGLFTHENDFSKTNL
jgi:hypothetical protein